MAGRGERAWAVDRISSLSATLLGDRDEKTRIAAAIALGRLADRRGVDALMRALGDKSKLVRGVAASALGHIGDARAISSLEKALSDSSSEVRKRARTALTELRSKDAKRAQTQTLVSARPHASVGFEGVRAEPRFHVLLKATQGGNDKALSPVLAKLLGQLLRKELDENPDITTDPQPEKRLKQFVIDSAIRRIWHESKGPFVETSCEVKLTVSDPDGRILSIVTGAATVQTGRAYYKANMSNQLQEQALENAVKGAHQNLVTFLNR